MAISVREHSRYKDGSCAALIVAMSVYDRHHPTADPKTAAVMMANIIKELWNGSGHVHVAEENGEIVGFLAWRLVTGPQMKYIAVQHPAVLATKHFTAVAGALLAAMEQAALEAYPAQHLRGFYLALEGDDVFARWAEDHGYHAEKAVRLSMAGLHKLTMIKPISIG